MAENSEAVKPYIDLILLAIYYLTNHSQLITVISLLNPVEMCKESNLTVQ